MDDDSSSCKYSWWPGGRCQMFAATQVVVSNQRSSDDTKLGMKRSVTTCVWFKDLSTTRNSHASPQDFKSFHFEAVCKEIQISCSASLAFNRQGHLSHTNLYNDTTRVRFLR